MPSVLIVDDDKRLRDTLSLMLEEQGFQVSQAGDGRRGLDHALTLKPDLMIVDLCMPGLSGREVCQQLRAADFSIPIIVLSAAGEEVDKVLLLEMGADDYVVKPFGARELLARVHAVLRRASAAPKVVTFGENEVDLECHVVRHRGRDLNITPVEFNLLSYFLRHLDQPLTREAILSSVWGPHAVPNLRIVDAHVVKLRQKLETDPGTPRHFVTLVGVGYRFVP
jgi:DNA-binding response OmpR family regulator